MAYYGSGCDNEIADHLCGACDTENARVRGWAFVYPEYQPTLLAALDDSATWAAGIAAGLIIMIPEGQGEYDGGTATEETGDGDQPTVVVSYTFIATVLDPNYKGNRDFYNSIKKSTGLYFAFRSETVVFLSTKPVVVIPTNPIANDINAKVKWSAQVKWVDLDHPVEGVAPLDQFVCYIP